MDQISSAINWTVANWEILTGGFITIMTLLNQLMPETITNAKLAKLEAVTSALSFGTKKAVTVKNVKKLDDKIKKFDDKVKQ